MSESLPFRIKVCGLTDACNAVECVRAGAQALGLNFCSASNRYCSPDLAAQIVRAVPSHVTVVGLFVDASYEEIAALRDRCGFSWVQLHGAETASLVRQLGPRAYKAVNGATDRLWPGSCLMVDAPRGPRDAIPGGHGRTWHWKAASEVPRATGQALLLAGGLTPSNVEAAIAAANADAVDVASGVESAPGWKDPELVRSFVLSAERGFQALR